MGLDPHSRERANLLQEISRETIANVLKAAGLDHPDRHPGDNRARWHEEMKLINEAFAILNDPQARRNYDAWRVHQNNLAAQQAMATATEKAKAQAENYPQDYREFESWLDKLTRDFANAEYRVEGGYLTVDKSASGTTFMVVGGIVGIIATFLIAMLTGAYSPWVWVGIPAGAGVGAWLHKQIGNSLRQPNQSSGPSGFQSDSSRETALNQVISCPQCQGRLRVPQENNTVRCPRCLHVFQYRPQADYCTTGHQPATGSRSTPGDSSLASNQAHQRGITGAVVVGIIAFVILLFVCTTTAQGIFGEPITDTNWGAFLLEPGLRPSSVI